MIKFAGRRLLSSLPALILVLLLVFSLVRMIPGDPAVALLGAGATDEQIEFLREQLNLNQPFLQQLGSYLVDILHGDLGESMRTKQPVMQELLDRLPATLELSIFAAIIAIIIGVPLGILSAKKPNSFIDHFTRVFSLIGVSAPAFWLALILQLIFSLSLGWFPVSGRLDAAIRSSEAGSFVIFGNLFNGHLDYAWSGLQHIILPAFVLAAFYGAVIARFLRTSMIEVIHSDYIRTAKGKGVKKGIILRSHELRNALLPVVTIMGLKFAEMLSGSILTETVFSWPGIGRYMRDAISNRDYPVVQGAVLMFAVIYMISSFLVDLVYGLLDPRIRM